MPETFTMVRTGAEVLHLVGREARDGANHPAVHKTALPTKSFRAPKDNSAAVTKPWVTVTQ